MRTDDLEVPRCVDAVQPRLRALPPPPPLLGLLTRERSKTSVHKDGEPTRTQAEAAGQSPSNNPDTVLMKPNNGWKCLLRGFSLPTI